MRRMSFAATIMTVLIGVVCLNGHAVADDVAKAKTTGSTKPNLGAGPANQESLPSSAPAPSTTGTTGATDQNNTVKAMNSSEKSKVSVGGK